MSIKTLSSADEKGRLYYEYKDPGDGGRTGRLYVDKDTGKLFKEGDKKTGFAPREAAAALAGMLAVARGEASVASAEFEKVTLAAKGCRATVTDEVLGLLRWSAGDCKSH